MKFYHLASALSVLITGAGIVGCTDSDYDLSDIDTTAQFNVNNLVIPVNLSDIVLSDII